MDEQAHNQQASRQHPRARLKVLVADDSPEFLVAAIEHVKRNPRMETVGMALSGEEAIRVAHRVKPDLVLVDANMANLNGAQTTAMLKQLDPPPRVVVVSGCDDSEFQSRITAAGADAFLLKDEFLDRLDPVVEKMFFGDPGAGRESLSESLGQRIRKLNLDATIVLIDDDFVTQELVEFLLTDAGYRVVKAGTGMAGLELVRTHRPDLVLLDVGLPDISGIEVCRRIKSDPALERTLVMHLSATHTSEKDMAEGLAGGADAYFTLPFQKEQLLARVDSLVRIARLESAMRANDTFFEHLYNQSDFGIAHTAPDGSMQSINEPLRRMLGLEENWRISGRSLGEFAAEPDRPALQRAIERLAAEELAVYRSDCRFLHASDSRFWVRLTIFPQRDGTGKVARLMILCEDITPQKQAAAIQEAMLESIPASIALLDPKGRILATNKSWDEHFKALQLKSRSLTPGGNFLDYCAGIENSQGANGAELVAGLGDVLARRSEMFDADYSRGADGQQRWFRITANAMAPAHSEGGLVMHLDITDRHKLEQQLRQSQKMDALGQLAGGVAHDFSNLLMVIRCNADILARPKVRPEIRATCIRDIQTAAGRASELTRQLLAFSRQQPMELREIDLAQSVNNLISMLRRLIGESVELSFEAEPDLPRTMGDAGMIDQILINLAVNARDAMPGGGRLRFALRHLRRAAPEGQHTEDTDQWIELSASDTGAGIPPEIRDKIFEPFFTTKAADQGTGLGLATVHGIVKQHNGWIDLDSESGRGTTFRIYFPAVPEDGALAGPAGQAPPLKGRGQGILVVEDDADVLNSIVRTFRETGFQVWAASDAESARAIWQERQSDLSLVLVDIVLPGGQSGEDLVEQFRRRKPDLVALLISGYQSEPARIVCGEHTRFVQKPFSLEELTAIVSQFFDEH